MEEDARAVTVLATAALRVPTGDGRPSPALRIQRICGDGRWLYRAIAIANKGGRRTAPPCAPYHRSETPAFLQR